MKRHCFTTEVYYDHKNNKTTLEIPDKLVRRLSLDYGEELSLIEDEGSLIISKLVNVDLDLSPEDEATLKEAAQALELSIEEYITEVLNRTLKK